MRHRDGRAPLVPPQHLSPLRHGPLHGAAGAAQHGDRVSRLTFVFTADRKGPAERLHKTERTEAETSKAQVQEEQVEG